MFYYKPAGVTLTFLGCLLQIGKVVSVTRTHFEKRHVELMKELHCHLKAEKKVKINDHSKVMNDHSD